MERTIDEIIELVDPIIAPNGTVDIKVFGTLFDKWSVFIAEAVCFVLSKDRLAGWEQTSLKHRIFNYIPGKKTRATYPILRNDLPYAIAWAITQEDPDEQDRLVRDLRQDLKS